MEPMQIVLTVLAAAGVWAVVELALTLRRARGIVDSIDKAADRLADTIEEARPMVAKLDGVVDELQPVIGQIEPLLKQAQVAVEALSADLIEVNGVLRDVSTVSGAASSASNAVSGIADAASEKVQRLFGKGPRGAVDRADRALVGSPCAEDEGDRPERVSSDVSSEPRQYYTYTPEESVNE